MDKKGGKYQAFLLCLFIAIWIAAAVNPVDREGWLNENYVVFVGVPLLIFLIRYFKLSNLSVTFITAFMILHVFAFYYGSYINVPFGFTLQGLFHSNRNMYDRFVHFCFGLLIFYPIREAFMKISKTKGFWTYYVPVDIILSLSALFEIVELFIVWVISPGATDYFMGFQNDFLDTTKDMLNAFAGALVSMFFILILNLSTSRKNRKELKKSFKIKNGKMPQEEARIRKFLKKASQTKR